MDGRMYEVILEWNGDPTRKETRRPPSKWYRYLERLTGMSVRKNGKDALNMMDSRMNDGDYGVIIQEGCIRCGSYSLARTIYFLAKNGLWIDTKEGSKLIKPDAVLLAEVNDLEVEMSPADEEALALMSKTFSHRGRRAGDPMIWTVSCFEDLASYQAEDYSIINCPHCGGLHIRSRVGEQNYFADPGGSVRSAWMRTRFATGKWEVPRKGKSQPPAHIEFKDEDEKVLVSRIIASTNMDSLLDEMDREDAMRTLDAILVSRLYWSSERRQRERMAAYMSFTEVSQGQSDEGKMFPDPNFVDIFDAAGPIGPEWAASKLWRHVVNSKPEETTVIFRESDEIKMPDPHQPLLSVVTP